MSPLAQWLSIGLDTLGQCSEFCTFLSVYSCVTLPRIRFVLQISLLKTFKRKTKQKTAHLCYAIVADAVAYKFSTVVCFNLPNLAVLHVQVTRRPLCMCECVSVCVTVTYLVSSFGGCPPPERLSKFFSTLLCPVPSLAVVALSPSGFVPGARGCVLTGLWLRGPYCSPASLWSSIVLATSAFWDRARGQGSFEPVAPSNQGLLITSSIPDQRGRRVRLCVAACSRPL